MRVNFQHPSRRHPGTRRGVALIIVMLMLLAMAGMAAAFAYAMRVETRLASNTDSTGELEWLGLSGVEFAKWVLFEQQRMPSNQGCNTLRQFWAGGPGDPDQAENAFEGIDLSHVEIGPDSWVAIRIVDAERKININTADARMLETALNLAGAGASDASAIHAALTDWKDRDDLPTAGGGAESTDYYLRQDPPYRAKNGPIDDIAELLKVRGVTPELYYGAGAGTPGVRAPVPAAEAGGARGLADIFCALSSAQVNINTAPEAVLQVVLRGDANLARQIIQVRAGPDGVDGTEDDDPAKTPAEIPKLLGPGAPPANFTSLSSTFEVHVEAHYGRSVGHFIGTIQRQGGARNFQMLVFRSL
jgi:general secretion pathway protein K